MTPFCPSSLYVDRTRGVAQVIGDWIRGDHDVRAGLDLDGAVAAAVADSSVPALVAGVRNGDVRAVARAAVTVGEASVLSISDLFAEYAAAGRARRAEIRLAADPELRERLAGFDYPAAA